MSDMSRRSLVVCTCLTALIAVGLAVSGASATTAPSSLTTVNVTMTDKGMTIAPDQYTRNDTARYPRGAIIDFAIKNRGTHFYKARLSLTGKYTFSKYEQKARSVTTGAAAKPGGTLHLKVNFYFRNKFALQAILGGKSHGAAAPIVVF